MYVQPTYNAAGEIDDKFGLNRRKSQTAEMGKLCGLIERSRFIHIFYDKSNPNPTTFKAIQVNVSVTRGDMVDHDEYFISKENGTLSLIAVYTYVCHFDNTKPLKEAVLSGDFILTSAKLVDKETDFNIGRTLATDVNMFSNSMDNIRASSYSNTRPIPDPRFYTTSHWDKSMGDFSEYGISDKSYRQTYKGYELVDDKTILLEKPITAYETLHKSLSYIHDQYDQYSSNGGKLITDAASAAITSFNNRMSFDNLIVGGAFAYDTDFQEGLHQGSAMLLKKYITPTEQKVQIQSFDNVLLSLAQSAESEWGRVRFMFSPSTIGSKCKIIFKDHNDLEVSGGIGSSKDAGFEIEEVMYDRLDTGSMIHDELLDVSDYLPSTEINHLINMYHK